MRKKIGELLIESGAVNPEQVRKALGQQRAFGSAQKLGSVIVTLGFASPSAVARALARQFDLPFVELPEIPEQLRSLVSQDFQAEQRIVPFRIEKEGRSERLHVAVDDPSDLSGVDELSFQLNKPIRVHVASEDDLDRALGLVRGRVVDGIALEDDTGEPLELEGSSGMVAGSWHGEESPPEAPPSAVASLFDWELPSGQTVDDDDDNSDITLITPRSALKPTPPGPPAPPPLDDDDEEITLITPRAAKPKGAAVPPPPPPPENEDVLDELLGEAEPEPTIPSGTPGGSGKSVPVVVFGGAAKGVSAPPPSPSLSDISEDDLKVLEDIERIADGGEATLHTEKVKPARMVASLIRLLIKKRVIREEEFLEELSRK
ncbi:MAG TPA: hypothetical protein VF794_27235 [Archangium sp.]|jgi:hypothetical protein|uniref:GspE/PulE/PilB domain-containing protein n=1 Tax=Archangium sp. TaxID=1872627 RepID=UPI002ED93B29